MAGMESYRAPLEWIDSQRDAMAALLRAWAGLNSGTFNVQGLAEQCELLAREFASIADRTERLDPAPYDIVNERGETVSVPLGQNLHVVRRAQAPLQVLLAIHMDTVYGPESTFQTVDQPDAHTLRGPGVTDAKGGLVVMLFALRALEQFVAQTGCDRLGWEALLNSDEEIGSPGSRHLFQGAARRVQLALLYEPPLPGGVLVGSRKGTGNFAIIVQGRSAHSGRDFQLGRNAIVAAAEMATQLHGLTGRWPGMTLNIARIDGGGPSNIVPDRAVLRFNIRYADPQHAAEIRQAVQQTLDAVAARFEVSAWLQGEFSSPPKLLDAPTQALLAQFQDCGEALGLKIEWGYSGGASDGNRLAAAGVPNLDTLGPRGGAIHSHDEFVLLDSLPERARLTALFLMRLADGTLPPLSHSAAPT